MQRFAVIGLGRFGSRLAMLLTDAGAEVIAVDDRREIVEDIRDHVTLAVCMNGTEEDALRAQGIDRVDTVIVGIGENFEDAILTTVILKQIGVPKVIARATTAVRGEILKRVGADEIVNPEREAAERWQARLSAPSILDLTELAEDFNLVQKTAPETMVDRTLEQLELRKKYQVNLIAIRRQIVEVVTHDEPAKVTQKIISVPMADTVIQKGDILILVGSDEAIASLPEK